MYDDLGQLSLLENDAEKFILDNDRLLYKPFFDETEIFCQENDIVIGGKVGIDLLLDRKMTKDSWQWDLYCDDIYRNSMALADRLSKVKSVHIPANTVAMQTNIKNKEFTILINARIFFKIYVMDNYRKNRLLTIMEKILVRGYMLEKSIRVFPPDIQLINIYRKLYSPNDVSQWKQCIENEKDIFNILDKSTSKFLELENIYSKKLFDIIPKIMKKKNILIGDYALFYNKIIERPSRMQIITDNLDELTDIFNKNFDGKIRVVKYYINLPDDFQLIKNTIYYSHGDEQTSLADVYNSTEYEMVPYKIIDDIKIGNLWVILRFIFIDIWLLKLIQNMSKDNSPYFKGRMSQLMTYAQDARNKLPHDFQLQNYYGVFIGDHIAKKKLIKDIGKRYPIYYPALK